MMKNLNEIFNNSNSVNLDMIEKGQIGTQDPGSKISFILTHLYNYMAFYMVFMLVVVLWMVMKSLDSKIYTSNFSEDKLLEFLWSCFPVVILMMIAFPSIYMLFLGDLIYSSLMSINIMGHQWYWEYMIPWKNKKISKDSEDEWSLSCMSSIYSPLMNLNKSEFFYQEISNSLIIPCGVKCKMKTSSDDVIHSFCVPSLTLKMDSVPGSLNQSPMHVVSNGVFYGSCAEMCGSLHSFMPMMIQSINFKKFKNILKKLDEF